MKKFYRLFLTLAFFLITYVSSAQCVIPSTNGYQVNVTIIPKTVVVSSTDCPWGYNYNLTYEYRVTFTGINIPSALYTLQTLIKCNGQVNGGYTMPLSGGLGTSTTTTNPAIPHTGTAYSYGSNPDCLHATVQTLHCNQIQVVIAGPGIPSQTVNCNYTGSVLPVELVDYTAALTNDGVELNWSTASELRNDYFTIYKSADGQNWTKVAKIAGAGTTTSYNSYAWIDESPETGINYYKLTQTDLDGTIAEQGIAGVEYVSPEESMTTVYPNPSLDGAFHIRVVTSNQSPVQVILRDQLGRIAGQTTLAETDKFGKRFISQDIVRTESGSGFYIVEILQDNELIGRHKVEVLSGN
jgi:hypothetical protein